MFNKIDEKRLHTFTIFAIKDFYSSIKETLLKNTKQFAAEHTDINKHISEVKFHARKSLSNQPWFKRDGETFDKTMGAYDGAEICELVGIFMLSLLSNKYSFNDIGLYRDDGLSVFRNISEQQAKKKHKKIVQKTFKDKGLQIIIKSNLKIVGYLGVTLNLNDGTYCPFHKPNEETTYSCRIRTSPANYQKIPRSIEKRLSRLSSTKEILENSKDCYEQRLRQCRYNEKLNYREENKINKKSRKRNILWFNLPHSKLVKTNIGKIFLRLINKHFLPTHKYRKIFNRNTIKISYSCMPNIKSKISTHNYKILNKPVNQNAQKCNYINKNNCPLNRYFPPKIHPVYSDNKV